MWLWARYYRLLLKHWWSKEREKADSRLKYSQPTTITSLTPKPKLVQHHASCPKATPENTSRWAHLSSGFVRTYVVLHSWQLAAIWSNNVLTWEWNDTKSELYQSEPLRETEAMHRYKYVVQEQYRCCSTNRIIESIIQFMIVLLHPEFGSDGVKLYQTKISPCPKFNEQKWPRQVWQLLGRKMNYAWVLCYITAARTP
jgi:hypothetical protein